MADAALYSEKNIQELDQHKLKDGSPLLWISRVPSTINEAQQLIQNADKSNMVKIDENYNYLEVCSNYGDVHQRWILIFSEAAYKKEF